MFIHITLTVFNGVHASRKLDVIKIAEETFEVKFFQETVVITFAFNQSLSYPVSRTGQASRRTL